MHIWAVRVILAFWYTSFFADSLAVFCVVFDSLILLMTNSAVVTKMHPLNFIISWFVWHRTTETVLERVVRHLFDSHVCEWGSMSFQLHCCLFWCTPISRNIKTSCLMLHRSHCAAKTTLPVKIWTPHDLWRWVLVSGTRKLAVDPLRPLSYEMVLLWIRFVSPAYLNNTHFEI